MLQSLILALLFAVPPGTIQVTKVTWSPGPPALPKGTQIAVLEGDQTKAGMFTLRLKLPRGAQLPPHWHPRPERVTVLSGEVRVGFGDKVSKDVTTFRAGSFYVNPALAHHFVSFPQETVIQITGEGPWEVHRVE
ncbi:MAG TPA: cupin domain-containing protein [Thermoanaerobaculia bacterium]|jgi:quercetin dioxygenase-like cupin family protein|nr:cupin domain-containing protein [Thermoanaerobaculia bacterium]